MAKTKQLQYKPIRASIAIGDELLVPYSDSVVYADFIGNEIYILIKNKKDPSKQIKLFFKDIDAVEFDEVKDSPIGATS